MTEARCRRKKSGAHLSPPSLLLASLHPDPFKLLTLLSVCLLVPESVQGMNKGLALTDPGSFLVLLQSVIVLLQSVARKLYPHTTHVWQSLCSKPCGNPTTPFSLGITLALVNLNGD